MIRDVWQNLTSRDQKFLLYGGIIAVVLLLYAFAWSPMSTAVDNLKQQVSEQRQLVVWLQAASAKIQQYRASGFTAQDLGNQPLAGFLNNSLWDNGLNRYVSKTIPSLNNTVTIAFNQVPFDNLIAWLETLWRTYGLDTVKLKVAPTRISGLVKAEVVIGK